MDIESLVKDVLRELLGERLNGGGETTVRRRVRAYKRTTTGKRKMSAAGRARIRAAVKKRWAAYRKSKRAKK